MSSNKEIRLGIFGAAGRMGQALVEQSAFYPALKLVALIEAKGNSLVGTVRCGIQITDDVETNFSDLSVAIDFTSPEASVAHAETAAKVGLPLVIGSTGIDVAGRAKLATLATKTPIVFSPNMSLSANVLFDVVQRVANLLPTYDAEITEIHHNLKKDAPSGTALRFAESVRLGRQAGRLVFGREGQVGARKPDEIGVHAIRGGDVVGDHTTFFLGTGERLELVHRVTSRSAFAQGALTAAQWLVNRPPALYDMRDVLGLSK